MWEFILLLGIGDRVRGSGWFHYNHGIGMLIMNIAAIALLQPQGWWLLYALLVPALGYAPALNPALSDAWYGKFNPKILTRAVLWGAPWALINILAPIGFILGYLITPVIFGKLEKKFGPFRKFGMDWWGMMEFTRGIISGIGLYLVL